MSAMPDDDPENSGGGAKQLFLPGVPAAAEGNKTRAVSETSFARRYVQADCEACRGPGLKESVKRNAIQIRKKLNRQLGEWDE